MNEMISVEGAMTTTSTGSIAVAQSRAMASELCAMQAAKAFPRDVRQSLERIKTACMRTGLAAVATYTYSRGGTDISGPSIRLAEVLANNWGNIRAGIKELEKRDGESTVLAYCHDLETNTQACSFLFVHSFNFLLEIKSAIAHQLVKFYTIKNNISSIFLV